VDHTDLLPLIPIAPHLSMDARERYGDDYVDGLYRAEVMEAENQTAREDEETSGEISNTHDATGGGMNVEALSIDNGINDRGEVDIDDSMAGQEEVGKNIVEYGGEVQNPGAQKDDEDAVAEKEEEVANVEIPEWTPKETFTALIAFFEASIRETLKPTNVDEHGIPTEIYETIISHVVDMQTYNACLKVSRRIRGLCLRRPQVLDNVRFLEPQACEEEPQACEEEHQPIFSAVEVSSNRRMDITIGWRRSPDSTTCQFIAGSEKERRAFVADEEIIFQGINVPSDWDWVDHSTVDNFRAASLPESTDKRWNTSISSWPITEESSTNDMKHFWLYVMKHFRLDIKLACHREWELPPNTKFFLATYEVENEDRKKRKWIHYLAVRVRRASKYWTCLWDDIVRETVTSLGSLDDTFPPRIAEIRGPQLLGAAHPFVLLAVGSEVRLFKWMPTLDGDPVMEDTEHRRLISDRLVELHPGQIFSTLHDEGRKPISEFLEQVKKYEGELIQMHKTEKVTKCEG